ncbi:hypothetical protein PG985_006990 [Apiospora marii]|uniref:uncharacterized protein n=1 Tax=Apiospora marii TaxID=335849 RepID=UPI00312CDB7F
MDNSMVDTADQESAVREASVEGATTKDTEVAIPSLSAKEERPKGMEPEPTTTAEAVTPTNEDKHDEESRQLTSTTLDPPSPISRRSKKKKAKKYSSSQPEESVTAPKEEAADLSINMPASASVTEDAAEPGITSPSQDRSAMLDEFGAAEEKRLDEAPADIRAQPSIAEPLTVTEQTVPGELSVPFSTEEKEVAVDQGLSGEPTVQPSPEPSVLDEPMPTTSKSKKKKGKKTQSIDTTLQDPGSTPSEDANQVTRSATLADESAEVASKEVVNQQNQEPATLEPQPTDLEVTNSTPAEDHFKEQTTVESEPAQVDVAQQAPADQGPQEQATIELQPTTEVEVVEKVPADQHLEEQTTIKPQPVVGRISMEEPASETVVPTKKSKKKKNKKSQSTIELASDSLVPSVNEPLQDALMTDASIQPQPDGTTRSEALPSSDVPQPDDARQAEADSFGESAPVMMVPGSDTHQSAPDPEYLPSAPGVHLRPMGSGADAPREESYFYFPSALSMLPAVSALQGHASQPEAETKSSEQQGPPSELEDSKKVPEEPHSWAEDSDRRGEPGELGTEALRFTPAPVQTATGFDGPDLSKDKSPEPTVAGHVEEAPSQPDLFSGEDELQRDPGRLGLADPPQDPLVSVGPVEPGRDAGGLPAQPPMAVGENDAPAGDITAAPSSTTSTQDGPKIPIDISALTEESGASKKGKKNKKKKRQSVTESLDPQPEAPSSAIEPVEDPLSRASPSTEQRPIEPIEVAQEPSSHIEDQPVERQDTVDADGVQAMAKKARKSQKASQVFDDLGDVAPTVEDFTTESARDDAVSTQGNVASEPTPVPSVGVGEAHEAQPDEEWASSKRSKKDKKKKKASSVSLDTELIEPAHQSSEFSLIAEDPLLESVAPIEPPVGVDDQAIKEETSSQEVAPDDEWPATPSKKSKKSKMGQASLADESAEKPTDITVDPTSEETPEPLSAPTSERTPERTPEDASEQVSVTTSETAPQPTPEADVLPPTEEVTKPEDDQDTGLTTPKKTKTDKKKRKSVTFADSVEEQPLVSLEKAQTGAGNSGPRSEPSSVDSEVTPEPVTMSDLSTGESPSNGTLDNKDEPAHSVFSSEPLEATDSRPEESTKQDTTNRNISVVSADDEFPVVTKKSKKDKKKAKRKSQEQDPDISTLETSTPSEETVTTTDQHAETLRDIENNSAPIQDESIPEKAMAEAIMVDEPEQVKTVEPVAGIPSERPQSPSAASEAADKSNADPRILPNEDVLSYEQPTEQPTDQLTEQLVDRTTETSAEPPVGEQPEEQPVQTQEDEYTVVPTKKSKKDKKKKKGSQTRLPESSGETDQSFLAPGQPSEKEPSTTEPLVTEDIAGPSEEQPVEEQNHQDGTIVADKSTLKAGLEPSEVAHETSSILAERASVDSNTATVPELQSTSEYQIEEDTLQQDKSLPEQTNALDADAEDKWGFSTPTMSKKDRNKEKREARLFLDGPFNAPPTAEASTPSPVVEAPIEAPTEPHLFEEAISNQIIAPSFEDKSNADPSGESGVSGLPEPDAASPKRSKKDKKKKKLETPWEDDIKELPVPSENELVILPSETAPGQVREAVFAKSPPEEQKEVDVLSTDEKNGSPSEQAAGTPLGKQKEEIVEDFAPVKQSKKDKKKKKEIHPFGDDSPRETAPEPSEPASPTGEESASQPIVTPSQSTSKVLSETAEWIPDIPVEEEIPQTEEASKDEGSVKQSVQKGKEANLEDPTQPLPVREKSLNVNDTADYAHEAEPGQTLDRALPAEPETDQKAQDTLPEFASSKKSKNDKKKKGANRFQVDPEHEPFVTDGSVTEAVVFRKDSKGCIVEEPLDEVDVQSPATDLIVGRNSLPAIDDFKPESESPEFVSFKKSKNDKKKASRERYEQESLPTSPLFSSPAIKEQPTTPARQPVDELIRSEEPPRKSMREGSFEEPTVEKPSTPSATGKEEYIAQAQSVPDVHPARQEPPIENTISRETSVPEDVSAAPALEGTATRDLTKPGDDLERSAGGQTTVLPEVGLLAPEQAPADDLATELPGDASNEHDEFPSLSTKRFREAKKAQSAKSFDHTTNQTPNQTPNQTQMEDATTSELPIRVFSEQLQATEEAPVSAATPVEAASASRQRQSQENTIDGMEREEQSPISGEQPVNAETSIPKDDEISTSPISRKKSKKDKKRKDKAGIMTEPGPASNIEAPAIQQELRDRSEQRALSEALPIYASTAISRDAPMAEQHTVPKELSVTQQIEANEQSAIEQPVTEQSAIDELASEMRAEDTWADSFTAKKPQKDKRKGKDNLQLESEPYLESHTTSLPTSEHHDNAETELAESMRVDTTDQPQAAPVSLDSATSFEGEWADSESKKSRKKDKKKQKALADLTSETIPDEQTPVIPETQVETNDSSVVEPDLEASKDVTMGEPVPSEELPVTPAVAGWADHGTTKKDTAILEPETPSKEHMSDIQHSTTTKDISPDGDAAEASFSEPATDELIPGVPAPVEPIASEPAHDEWAATTSNKGKKHKKRKSSTPPEAEQETVPKVLPFPEELGSLGDQRETVSRGVPTEPMTVDQSHSDAPTSTEPASAQTGFTEAGSLLPTPPTPERAISEHRQASGPVEVDLSPAQLSSHIDHEPPFDQSTQPGKKVRMQSFLGDSVIPEPLSATQEPASASLEDPTPQDDTSPASRVVPDDNFRSRDVPESDSVAREIAASYFDQPASSKKSRARDMSLKLSDSMHTPSYDIAPNREVATSNLTSRGQNMPSLDMKHKSLPALTPQRDLAVSYFEKGPSNRQKYTHHDQEASAEDAQRSTEEAEALLAASALTGGVEKMAEQFGLSKKARGKKSKSFDNITSQEDIRIPDTITAKAEGKASNRTARSLPKHVEDTTSDSPESPIVGRGQKTCSVADRSVPSKEPTQTESRESQDSQSSELMRDIEELDTSEPQVERSHAVYQSFGPMSMSSHDMADFGRGSTMSSRSLPRVEEETHEDLEDDMGPLPQPGLVVHTPEINRDSGFMTDSPNPVKHSQFQDATQRDSGVHLREGLSTLDEGARLSWASTDSKGTSKPSDERRLKKSPLGDDIPRLNQYSVGSGSRSPPSDPSKMLDPRKPRTPGPDNRTPSPAYQQRSVSDNVRHFEDAARADAELQAQLRRSASNTSISRLRTPRTPEPLKLRPDSPGIRSLHSSGANTPPLRRVERMSADLRSLGQHGGSHSSLHSLASKSKAEPDPYSPTPAPAPAAAAAAHNNPAAHGPNNKTTAAANAHPDRHRASQNTTPVANEGRVRASRDMAEISYVSRQP